ncbi:MAG: Abi family protein [Massilistercora timonensis]
MDEINYTTPTEQIEKLRSQNMIILNEDFAKEQLQQCGYSNLIKSYRDPYTLVSNGRKIYRSGITFEQVLSLYTLDKNLRNAVMSAMLDLEEHIKEAAADVVASSFGVHQDRYLQFRNYRDKSKRKRRFSLAGILETMQKTLKTDKNPIFHYSSVHGIVPPWILFKSIYFSSLEYRNLAAHGGRIYNYKCKNKLRVIQNTNSNFHGFSLLLLLLSFFKYSSPFEILNDALTKELNRHCNLFPEDITYLGQILNVNITISNNVWVTGRSKKYHRDKHCSGILNAKSIDVKAAETQGYTPCKKCCK